MTHAVQIDDVGLSLRHRASPCSVLGQAYQGMCPGCATFLSIVSERLNQSRGDAVSGPDSDAKPCGSGPHAAAAISVSQRGVAGSCVGNQTGRARARQNNSGTNWSPKLVRSANASSRSLGRSSRAPGSQRARAIRSATPTGSLPANARSRRALLPSSSVRFSTEFAGRA
jgi:hypothetical protein